ncbi:MAG TPA: hypothetical protein VHC20_05035 [Candidatus Paceibacterota bacterium]|nr:hypothetical protein [Candidatus Paceibacterota bacterium]
MAVEKSKDALAIATSSREYAMHIRGSPAFSAGLCEINIHYSSIGADSALDGGTLGLT